MKSNRIFALILALVLALAPVTVFADGEETPKYAMDPTHLTFATQDDLDATIVKTKETELTLENGEIKLVATGFGEIPDPSVSITLENLENSINAEEYPYCALIYRCPTTNVWKENVIAHIYFNTKGASPSEEQCLPVVISVNDRYACAIFNPALLSDWNGTVTSIRLDYFYSAYWDYEANAAKFLPDGQTMFVHDVLFCKDEASARRDGGNIVYDLNKDDSIRTYDMDPTHVVYATKDDYDAVTFREDGKDPGKRTILSNEDGALKCVVDLGGSASDPYFYVSYGKLLTSIKAEDYPYCAVVYKLPTSNSVRLNTLDAYFNTKGAFPVDDSQRITVNTVTSDKYQYATFNPGTLTDWSGVITSLRFDYLNGDMSDGDVFWLHDVIFGADLTSVGSAAKAIADELNAPDEATLIFNVGSHGTAPESQIVKKGDLPVRPEDPVSDDGYVFDGWYTTTTYKIEFDFGSMLLKEKTTAYAKWVKGFVVTFDCGEGVEAPAAQTVKQNGRAAEPDIPERDGFTFRGWYADKDLTQAFDFGALIKEDTVVYAKWEEGAATKYAITVTGGTADKESAVAGAKITVTADAVEENYVFDHWDITGAIEFTNSDDSDGKSASFTFILGENDVSLEAIFVSTFEYTIEVENGTADKESARAGTVVTVTAAEPEEGMRFDHWEIEGLLEFMNEPDKLGKNASFSFRMCECNVKLTAVFTDASAVIPGDVNGDGKLNAKDVTAIMKYLVNAAPANFVEAAADYDGSGTINAKDVTKLMKYLVANP